MSTRLPGAGLPASGSRTSAGRTRRLLSDRRHTMPGPETPRTAAARVVNPWFVAVAVTVPTFMEVLDTSIANVALRYIAGGLSAASNDSEWVITSYLAANAIVLPLSGWLSTYLDRKST